MTKPNVMREAERIAESNGFDPQQVRDAQVNSVVTWRWGGISSDSMNVVYVGVETNYSTLLGRGEIEAGISALRDEEIESLKSRVAALEHEVEMLRTRLDENEAEVVVLRTISKEQAKREALELFRDGEPLLYSDVARKLRIDLAQAVEICEELIAEGEVTVHDDFD